MFRIVSRTECMGLLEGSFGATRNGKKNEKKRGRRKMKGKSAF